MPFSLANSVSDFSFFATHFTRLVTLFTPDTIAQRTPDEVIACTNGVGLAARSPVDTA